MMMTASQTSSVNTFNPLRENPIQGLLQLIGASLLIGIFAQIEIPLAFSPVPITGQTFGIMLVGAVLGSRQGALSVLLYLFEGCFLNLPVLAGGGAGFVHLIGPTGGYLIGFVVQAYLIGWFIEKQKEFNSLKILGTLLVSSAIQLGMGTSWLSHYVGWQHVMIMGFYPFVPTAILKALVVTTYLKTRFNRS